MLKTPLGRRSDGRTGNGGGSTRSGRYGCGEHGQAHVGLLEVVGPSIEPRGAVEQQPSDGPDLSADGLVRLGSGSHGVGGTSAAARIGSVIFGSTVLPWTCAPSPPYVGATQAEQVEQTVDEPLPLLEKQKRCRGVVLGTIRFVRH